MSGLHRIDSHHHHSGHHHGPDDHHHLDHHHGLVNHHHHPGADDHGQVHGDHEHGQPHVHSGPMIAPGMRSRRAFLGHLGKGTMAMAVFSPALLAACSSDAGQPVATAATVAPDSTGDADPTVEVEPAGEPDPTSESETPAESAANDDTDSDDAASDLVWARTNLGFVSAYVLVRGNTAAIVDTGTAGSAVAIGATLGDLGLNYSDVAHVLLTHHHSDHTGSIGEVLEMAVNATAYAGEADVPSISADVTGLAGGEDIFGFEMLSTPGHTLGHMAAIDHQAGLLIAGDAIFTEEGEAVEGSERFFMSVAESRRSIAAMAALSFNTLLVGHGDPIEGGADAAVAALAASLG